MLCNHYSQSITSFNNKKSSYAMNSSVDRVPSSSSWYQHSNKKFSPKNDDDNFFDDTTTTCNYSNSRSRQHNSNNNVIIYHNYNDTNDTNYSHDINPFTNNCNNSMFINGTGGTGTCTRNRPLAVRRSSWLLTDNSNEIMESSWNHHQNDPPTRFPTSKTLLAEYEYTTNFKNYNHNNGTFNSNKKSSTSSVSLSVLTPIISNTTASIQNNCRRASIGISMDDIETLLLDSKSKSSTTETNTEKSVIPLKRTSLSNLYNNYNNNNINGSINPLDSKSPFFSVTFAEKYQSYLQSLVTLMEKSSQSRLEYEVIKKQLVDCNTTYTGGYNSLSSIDHDNQNTRTLTCSHGKKDSQYIPIKSKKTLKRNSLSFRRMSLSHRRSLSLKFCTPEMIFGE